MTVNEQEAFSLNEKCFNVDGGDGCVSLSVWKRLCTYTACGVQLSSGLAEGDKSLDPGLSHCRLPKQHSTGGMDQTEEVAFSETSRPARSRPRCWSVQALGRALCLTHSASLCPHMAFNLCSWRGDISLSSFLMIIIPVRLGPHTY